MGKRSTIVAVSALALLIALIVFAVSRLYSGVPDKGGRPDKDPGAQWNVLRAVPSDAVAVAVFDGSRAAARTIADSSGLAAAFLTPGQPQVLQYMREVSRLRSALSLHNSGSLVPLVITEIGQADSTTLASYREAAEKAVLKSEVYEGFLLASRSETFIQSSQRHLDEGLSILSGEGPLKLVSRAHGPVQVFVSHSHAAKVLQIFGSPSTRRKTSFVKAISPWSSWTVSDSGKDHIVIDGESLPGEAAASFFAAFSGTEAAQALFPEVLPYFVTRVISIPVPDPDAFLENSRKYQDGLGSKQRFDKALNSRGGAPHSPGEWFRQMQPREIVKAVFCTDDGVSHEALLLRSAKDNKLGPVGPNPDAGTLGLILGEHFAVCDTLCVQLDGRWSAFGDLPTLQALSDRKLRETTLKDRFSDASLPTPQGWVDYGSLTDDSKLPAEILSEDPASAISAWVKGSGYAAAFASLDLSGTFPRMQLRLEKRNAKGTRVQVLERDTTVVVPTGLFPVKNSATGATNYLYQNQHLALCLNDENGKGVWGIPFKEKLCGAVQSIDYYNNGKIQFLFAAGSKLWLLDRLGHWVNGFPVELGKPVLLGPSAYDFTGAGGYTVMVLHKDNTLERYNLHGAKPEGWKGISAPETVKSLPELIEFNEKRFWAVRTSVQTLIYPFEGGQPLAQPQGPKMIQADSPLTPSSRGVTVMCYDGRSREIKLN